MKNDEYQKHWNHLFTQKQSSKEVADLIGIDEKMLETYKSFIWHHYISALKKMFPRINDLIRPQWKEISEEYYNQFPPYAWDINDLSQNFDSFIQTNKERLGIEEYYVELAKYELAEFNVYKHPSQQRINNYWQYNEASEIHLFQFNIGEWVQKLDLLEKEGISLYKQDLKPNHTPNVLAVSRSLTTNLCVFTSLELIDVALIEIVQNKMLLKGINPKEIAPMTIELLGDLNVSHHEIQKRINFLSKQSIIY